MTVEAIKTSNLQYQPMQQGGQSEDAVRKELQNELAAARKQLKEVGSGQENGVVLEQEAKEKKQQEIRKQISELNRELRQREMEIQKQKQQENRVVFEKQEQKASSTGTEKTEPAAEEQQSVKEVQQQMSSGYVEAFAYVDGAFRQMETQHQVVRSLNSQAEVFESEIQQDKGRVDVERKEARLEGMQDRAANAASLKLQVLGNFRTKIQKAEEIEQAEQTGIPRDRRSKASETDVFPQTVQRDEDGNVPDWKNFFRTHNHRRQLFAGVQLEMFA